MKIAIVSDIHGNSWAFKEVLSDIYKRGINEIINLGDSLYGPLDPKGTFDLLIDNNVVSILGNQDKLIIDNFNAKSNFITLEYVKAQIDINVIIWLKSLKFDLIYHNLIYCCHASPQSDSIYLLERLFPDFIGIKDKNEIDEILKDIQQKIVICGHSHISRVVETNLKTIINPGSVGLPAYDDDIPIPHKIENFSPMAKYAILTITDKLINVDNIFISYDYEQAAKIAELNNRADWARWIRTGMI